MNMNDTNSTTNTAIISGMPDVRSNFYSNTILNWISDKSASILVVGGGETDYNVLHKAGYTNVVISNLDARLRGDEFTPYSWSYQKAEKLMYEDSSFDFVVIHAALHHCQSPHQALLEMYRVAKIGAIAFESRDSLLMQFLEIIGLTPSYEHIAVYQNDGKFGGVNNTEVPNYIYRWTEREIEKTINTYAPIAKHQFYYQYGNDAPASFGSGKKVSFKRIFISTVKPFYQIFTILFPKQQNLFAFRIDKPIIQSSLHQWLKLEDGQVTFNYSWAQKVHK